MLDIAVSAQEPAPTSAQSHTITGKLTGPYGAPVVGRQVDLEVRSYPYKGGFKKVASATSGLDGRFAFERAFDRNHQVRVLAPESADRSEVLPVYVFPRTALTFGLVRRNVIRIVQTYRTPKNVKLTAPTLFYVGKAGKKRAPRAARAKTKPVRAKAVQGQAQGQDRPGPLPRLRAPSASRRRGAGASATRAASRTTRGWATRSWAARSATSC